MSSWPPKSHREIPSNISGLLSVKDVAMPEPKLSNPILEHKRKASMRASVAVITLSTSRSADNDQSGDIIEQLRDADPTRQDGDIGNEGDIAHQLFARRPGVPSEDS